MPVLLHLLTSLMHAALIALAVIEPGESDLSRHWSAAHGALPGHQIVIDALIKAASDEDARVRRKAVSALGIVACQCVPDPRSALRNTRDKIRRDAAAPPIRRASIPIVHVGRSHAPVGDRDGFVVVRTVAALVRALADDDPAVQRAALAALLSVYQAIGHDRNRDEIEPFDVGPVALIAMQAIGGLR